MLMSSSSSSHDSRCAVNETNLMFSTVLSLQPRAASGGGKSRDELLDETAADILERAPTLFNLEQVADAYPTMYEESMNTVLQQVQQTPPHTPTPHAARPTPHAARRTPV